MVSEEMTLREVLLAESLQQEIDKLQAEVVRLLSITPSNAWAYKEENDRLAALFEAAKQTLLDNLHLADGDDCTLYALREAVLAIDPTVICDDELERHKEQQELDWYCVEHQTKRAEAAEASLEMHKADNEICRSAMDNLANKLSAAEQEVKRLQEDRDKWFIYHKTQKSRAKAAEERAEKAEAEVKLLQEELDKAYDYANRQDVRGAEEVKRAEATEAKLEQYVACPVCGESCKQKDYATIDNLMAQLRAVSAAIAPCQVAWSASCTCSRGTKGCVMTHLNDPPSPLQVAEAKLAKAAKIVDFLPEVEKTLSHVHHWFFGDGEFFKAGIVKDTRDKLKDALREFDEETL
jgi:hypothetical protein